MIPNSVRLTLVSTSVVLEIWFWILMRVISGPSNTVFTPSVIENLLVFVLGNAEVVVIIWLMKWIDSSVSMTVRLKCTCENKETGTRFSVVFILVDAIVWIRQLTANVWV